MTTKLMLVLIVFMTLKFIRVDGKRGPHHPRGEYVVKRDTKKQEFDEHLREDSQHISEDLTGLHVNHKNVSEMSDEERDFYYFKIHDSDNNDKLDGLELMKAAMHRHDQEAELQEELSHVVGVVDNFLEFADIDNNGFLSYTEYVKALSKSDNQEVENANTPPSDVIATNEID